MKNPQIVNAETGDYIVGTGIFAAKS